MNTIGLSRLGVAAATLAALASTQRQPSKVSKPSPKPYYYTKLNRAKHWPYANTYAEARVIGPSTEPVR